MAKREAGTLRAWPPSVIATLVLGGAMAFLFAVKFFSGAPSFIRRAPLPPDMLFNVAAWVAGVPWVFNIVHALPFNIDRVAKYILFGIMFLAYLGLWLLFGRLYGALAGKLSRWGADLVYVAASVFFTGLVLLPIQPAGLGPFGLSENNIQYPPFTSALWSAFFGALFAAALHLQWPGRTRPAQVVEPQHDPGRRRSIRAILAGVLGVGILAVVGRWARNGVSRAQDSAQKTVATFIARIRGVTPEITAVADHYVVSKNIFNPSVAAESWALRVTGLVDREVTLTLEDLMAMPSVQRASTLMCVSNPVGGDLIGNSVWTGVHLRDILTLAGIGPGANEIILRAADNYSDSFPLVAGLPDSVIVAYLQNGRPLTRDHGFPARVLIPGIYGMKNVKWVVEIELAAGDYEGYWQQRGWSDDAVVKTMSRVDTARATKLEDGTWAIGGIAFAGLRGVQRVEVSVDGGETWQPARLDPAVGELSWNLWGFRWSAEPGTYDVLVRATDGTGETQTAERSRPLPDGASGWHRFRVRVG